MNKKDYDVIAEIIKKNKFDLISGSYSDMDIAMIKDLADYFEKEDKGNFEVPYKPYFNRQQFLKDCGVEK